LGVSSSEEILTFPHDAQVHTARLLEPLQRLPTNSNRPIYFLLAEDEARLLQVTIFEGI